MARILAAHKKSIPVGGENMMKALKMEEQPSKQAAQQDDAYNSHHQELGPVEQPRAWTSTPTRSLSPTTRPAGAGWLYRAGPSQRLVAITSVLCLTPPFLCETPELDMDYNKELPENVVVPLSNSGPLRALEPITLSQYEISNLSHYESEVKNLSLYEILSKSLSLDEFKTNDLPQSEIKPKDLSLDEYKMKDLPQSEIKPNDLSLSKIKMKDLPLSEIKYKDLSQHEMVSPSLPMFAYLPLLTKGAGGALTGHSTAAHRSLRSLPPALQPGNKEIKTVGLSGWSSSIKKVLTRTKSVMKKMEGMQVTLRPTEHGIFEHLPPECQESHNNKTSPMDEDECSQNALVVKGGLRMRKSTRPANCSSRMGPLMCACVHPNQKLFNSQTTTDSIETLGQVKKSLSDIKLLSL